MLIYFFYILFGKEKQLLDRIPILLFVDNEVVKIAITIKKKTQKVYRRNFLT